MKKFATTQKGATMSEKNSQRQVDLLETMLIVNLALAGVPQNTIKKIVGVSTNRVNDIAKQIPQRRRKDEVSE